MARVKEITWREAEKLVGHRLDRRRAYARDGKKLLELAKWTSPCTGCSCDGEYPCSCCTIRGMGCPECGYTGKRRNSMWVPYMEKETT